MSSQNLKMKKIWSEPVFLKNMNDYLIFWSYFIMLRFSSRMEYWDEIYENTLSCIECLRSPVGICPLLYSTFLPYCIILRPLPHCLLTGHRHAPVAVWLHERDSHGDVHGVPVLVLQWHDIPWSCWVSLSLSVSLPLSFFFFSLSISKQR